MQKVAHRQRRYFSFSKNEQRALMKLNKALLIGWVILFGQSGVTVSRWAAWRPGRWENICDIAGGRVGEEGRKWSAGGATDWSLENDWYYIWYRCGWNVNMDMFLKYFFLRRMKHRFFLMSFSWIQQLEDLHKKIQQPVATHRIRKSDSLIK